MGAQPEARTGYGTPGKENAAIARMLLGLFVQVMEDNGDNHRADQHPDCPKQPQEQQNTEVIPAHAHGVMHHATVEDTCYIFGGYFVSQIEWDVDHKINVV